jgi:hypothetical protein
MGCLPEPTEPTSATWPHWKPKFTYVPLGAGYSKTGSKAAHLLPCNKLPSYNIIKEGMLVKHNEETRYVYAVYFHYIQGYRKEIPGQRVVTHVNLGGSDTYVPVDKVRILQL